jgi:hypothetical protein
LELEEAEDGGGEGDKKAKDADKCGISCLEREVRGVRGEGEMEDVPRRLARSPLGAEGWKKRRSYWSGLSWRVIWRLSSL